MKQDETTNELMIITEENIKDMIYEIRDQKVMLDFDLARIYGYETKNFNRQIKNNINKFPKDFMFQLTKGESAFISRCKNFTAIMQEPGIKGGRTSLPYAFTEKGIYMLMTVLRGELATQQSIALIRLFQEMKDELYRVNSLLLNSNPYLESRFNEHERRIELVESKLDTFMKGFKDDGCSDHYLIMNNQRIEADIAYQQIYSSAKQSIIIIDDYISIKTLEHLKVCSKDISIIICSDNVARTQLTENEINDFMKDTGLSITLKNTRNTIHDRYIVIDYRSDNEAIYHSGSSSKDSGHKVTTIVKVEEEHLSEYYSLVDQLLI